MPICDCGHDKYGWVPTATPDNIVTFTKEAEHSKHHLHNPPGWCIQVAVVERHKDKVAFWVIHDTEKRVTLTISTANILKFAREIDRGFGKQYWIHDELWIMHRDKDPKEAAAGAQLSLF